MSVQVIGCLSATILYLRFFFYGFEAAVSAPCGRVANAPFLACLSSACSGVWPFRIRCQRASFLCLCRSGGLSATVLYLCFVFTVSKLQFRHRLEGLRTHRFWLRSCSCGTVWTGCERTVRKNHQGSAARAVALYINRFERKKNKENCGSTMVLTVPLHPGPMTFREQPGRTERFGQAP